MEPAIIDWKLETARARYVRDEVYENINAPRWTDLKNPDAAPVDDEAWFCRPDCRHPKTAEDFKRWTPSPKVKKLLRSSSEASPLGDKNNAKNNKNSTRDAPVKPRGGIGAASSPAKPKASTTKDAAVKRRGGMGGTGLTSKAKFQEDLENKDPNIGTVTPPGRQLGGQAGRKLAKEAIKSSAEKRDGGKEEEKKAVPRLRSTMSARNLFSGKDILGQISEFCNELKRMAMRKDRVAADVEVKKKEEVEEEEEEEKKGLLEGIVEEQGREGQNVKENSKLRLEDEGSTLQNVNRNSRNAGTLRKSSKVPLRVDTGKEKWKNGVDDKVLREVRANPPTPQRFSPSSSSYPRKPRALTTTNSPLNKPPKSTTLEREVLQDIAENSEERTALIVKAEGCNKDAGILDVEGRSGDMFWFFKPCSYLV